MITSWGNTELVVLTCSKTSMTRTTVIRDSLGNSSNSLRKQIVGDILDFFLLYQKCVFVRAH